jgi:squalene-hopene/tetraprenyl-beta-curcumene cyclase
MTARPAKSPAQQPAPPADPILEQALQRGVERLLHHQDQAGFWLFELEADATITSEYLLLRRWLGIVDPALEAKVVRRLLAIQGPDGGWPIYYHGPAEISATVKAYFALKVAGVPAEDPAMVRACAKVKALGGITRVNVFTRILLALFGELPWAGVPCMPVEIMLLPRWFAFNLYAVSYWSRTVLIPLLIIFAHRPVRPAPPYARLDELFLGPREEADLSFPRDRETFTWRNFFLVVDKVLRVHNRLVVQPSRRRAIRAAERWTLERMQGSGGLGAIYPAMANSVMALSCLGYSPEHPTVRKALAEIDALVLDKPDGLRVQPCVGPIWDTGLAMNALIEAGLPPDEPALVRAGEWLLRKQTTRSGDWQLHASPVAPGGWAFQFENEFYPDVDDTAVVLMALRKVRLSDEEAKTRDIGRGLTWLLALQGRDGGWGAYDKDNCRTVFNLIPFADHGALLDPSTEDLAGRVLEAMGYLGFDPEEPAAARALRFVRETQRPDGSWYGRWGVNYLYGTWSVLAGLRAIGEDLSLPYVRRAVAWLLSRQNPDGGWGESCYSYNDPRTAGMGKSTPSQTAWALLALMQAGEAEHPAVARGIRFLLDAREADGLWSEPEFTGTGFPRVFYLRYHSYPRIFPLWALGMYRRLIAGTKSRSASTGRVHHLAARR